jgi:hypothetical protein
MNDLVTNIKNLELETIKNLKNSKSENTLRAYQSDYKIFYYFVQKMGFKLCQHNQKLWPYI